MLARGDTADVTTPFRAVSRWCAGLLAGALAVLLVAPGGASAQIPESGVGIRLIAQPVWHGPADTLGIKIRVTNLGIDTLEGIAVDTHVHSRVTTRSALDAMFDGNTGSIAGSVSLPASDVTVEPGESTDVELDVPLADFPVLAGATEGGVFPLTISVATSGSFLGEVITPLIYYPTAPQARLKVSLVFPLNDVPARDPRGVFVERSDQPLEAAIAGRGWLRGVVRALRDTAGELPPIRERKIVRTGKRNRRRRVRIIERERPSVHLAVAPTPRLIEELADLGDGYRRLEDGAPVRVAPSADVPAAARTLLSDIGRLLQEDGIQPLLVPYAFPDLPTVARSAPDHAREHLEQATEVVAEHLGLELGDEWLFPPAGRIDASTLAELRADAQNTFFNVDALQDTEPPGCPQSFASFACAASVRGPEGALGGLVLDDAVQERLAALGRGGNDRLDLQGVFAELATIYQEAPGDPGRVIAAIIPSVWRPRPELARRFFEGLLGSPWITTVTPSEALADPEIDVRQRRLVTTLASLDDSAEPVAARAMETTDLVESFDLMRPPTELTRRLARNPLVAESRMWATAPELLDDGATYITETEQEIEEELSKIKLEGRSDVLLTSEEGDVPLVLFTEGEYPATVDVRVFSEPDLIVEPSLIEDQRIDPGTTHQLTLRARARSSGIFQVAVSLEAPDGSLEIARKIVRIRSTEFNDIALGITIGALVFLVLFYVVRVIRRRRTAEEPA